MKEPPYTPVPAQERSEHCQTKCHMCDPHDPSWHPCDVLCQLGRWEQLEEQRRP